MYHQWPACFTKTLFSVTFPVETPHRCKTSGDLRRAGCLLIKHTWYHQTTITKLWLQKPQSTRYLLHDHEKQELCPKFALSCAFVVVVSIMLTPHRGHTYPSWGTRTRALGRSSTEELTMVSRKSPSGLATWRYKGRVGEDQEGSEPLTKPRLWKPSIRPCLQAHPTCPLCALPAGTPCTPPLCPAYRHTLHTPSVPCLQAHPTQPFCFQPTGTPCIPASVPQYHSRTTGKPALIPSQKAQSMSLAEKIFTWADGEAGTVCFLIPTPGSNNVNKSKRCGPSKSTKPHLRHSSGPHTTHTFLPAHLKASLDHW